MNALIFFIAFTSTLLFIKNSIKSLSRKRTTGSFTRILFWMVCIFWSILYYLTN